MIAKKYRFHGHGSLDYLYKNGQTVRGKNLAIKFIDNPRRDNPRFAVVVSKKVCKSAVKRNRIRQRIYEIIRTEILPQCQAQNRNIDMAVIVYSAEVLDMEFNELKKQIKIAEI